MPCTFIWLALLRVLELWSHQYHIFEHTHTHAHTHTHTHTHTKNKNQQVRQCIKVWRARNQNLFTSHEGNAPTMSEKKSSRVGPDFQATIHSISHGDYPRCTHSYFCIPAWVIITWQETAVCPNAWHVTGQKYYPVREDTVWNPSSLANLRAEISNMPFQQHGLQQLLIALVCLVDVCVWLWPRECSCQVMLNVRHAVTLSRHVNNTIENNTHPHHPRERVRNL